MKHGASIAKADRTRAAARSVGAVRADEKRERVEAELALQGGPEQSQPSLLRGEGRRLAFLGAREAQFGSMLEVVNQFVDESGLLGSGAASPSLREINDAIVIVIQSDDLGSFRSRRAERPNLIASHVAVVK